MLKIWLHLIIYFASLESNYPHSPTCTSFSEPASAGDRRKCCLFSRQQHVSLHWISPLMCHHDRRHKPRIRGRPALLVGHQGFSLGLGPGSFGYTMTHEDHESDPRVVDPVMRAQACWTGTRTAHAGYVRLPSDQPHTCSGSSASPVWALAQEELIRTCQANARHERHVPQTYLVCCLVLLSFPDFLLLLIS